MITEYTVLVAAAPETRTLFDDTISSAVAPVQIPAE